MLRTIINIGIFLNIIISLFVIKITLYGDINPIELKSDPLRKLRGFETQSRELTRLINEERPVAVIFNRRSEITRFNYYMQKNNVYYNKVYFLTDTVIPKNHYEYFYKFKINDFKSKEKLIIITREKGIDRKYLRTIWELSDQNKAHALNFESFCIAMKYVGLAQGLEDACGVIDDTLKQINEGDE